VRRFADGMRAAADLIVGVVGRAGNP